MVLFKFKWKKSISFWFIDPRSLVDKGADSKYIMFLIAVVRALLESHVGKPSSAYGWSGGFPLVLQFSPTFDERLA